jgi:hypothetical protein
MLKRQLSCVKLWNACQSPNNSGYETLTLQNIISLADGTALRAGASISSILLLLVILLTVK